MDLPAPAFLIVGTPRSGTTLVQRLASELPGVAIPPETHFFSLFVAVCRNEMRAFGYEALHPEAARAALAKLSFPQRYQRLRFEVRRQIKLRRIARTSLA